MRDVMGFVPSDDRLRFTEVLLLMKRYLSTELNLEARRKTPDASDSVRRVGGRRRTRSRRNRTARRLRLEVWVGMWRYSASSEININHRKANGEAPQSNVFVGLGPDAAGRVGALALLRAVKD